MNLLSTLKFPTPSHESAHIYIKNQELRVTYYEENPYTSHGNKSDYINHHEVVDTNNFAKMLQMDYREQDICETLMMNGYFVIGEFSQAYTPNQLQFFSEYAKYISKKLPPKHIKRTQGESYLLLLPLNIPLSPNAQRKKISYQTQKVLEGYIHGGQN